MTATTLPKPDALEKIDLSFWGIRIRKPYVEIGHLPWSMDRCHTMIGTVAAVLGPDLLSSVVSSLPVLFSRGQVVAGVTSILVERSDRLEDSVRKLMGASLLRDALSDLYIVQGETGSQLVEPLADVLAPGNRAGRRMFSSVMDIYLAAWASGLENLLPLEPGGIDLRRSTPRISSAPVTETGTEDRLTDAVTKAETGALGLATIRHIAAWLQARQ